MGDELMIKIEFITSLILMAFLSFVPKMTRCVMGTALSRPQIQLFRRPPLNKFSPTSEYFSSFSPLPPVYCLLSSASLGAGAKTQAFVRVAPGSARAGIGSARAAPGSVRIAQVSARISQGSVPILQRASSSRASRDGRCQVSGIRERTIRRFRRFHRL